MRILTALGSIALVAMTVHAQETPSQRTIEVPISKVTVFPSGARITHVSTIQLEQGENRLLLDLFEDMKDEQLANLADLRAFSTGAHIREIGLVLHDRKGSDAELAELASKITTTREALQAARIRAANSRSDKELLDLFASRMADGAASLDRTQLLDLLSFLSERRRALAEDTLRQNTAATEQQKTLDTLLMERKRLEEGITVASVQLSVDSEGGEATISISWHDDGSSWTPAYRIEREAGSGSTIVTMDANVSNRSMLDWNDVLIELSSANPYPVALLDSVAPVSIDVVSNDARTTSEAALSFNSTMAGGLDKQTGATITNAGTVIIYSIDGPVSIDASSRRRLQIGRFNTTATMEAIARPTVDPEVYSMAAFENASNLLLLPGEVSLYIDGSHVGETSLDDVVPPVETFDIAYGPMPRLTIERTIVERETVSTGLLGGGRRTRTSYRIDIHNGRTTPIELVLEDRMPVSRNSEIEVTLKNISLPLSTDENYLAIERPRGILRWNIQLPAGGPDAPPLVVEWTVDVSRSADLDTTPIPE